MLAYPPAKKAQGNTSSTTDSQRVANVAEQIQNKIGDSLHAERISEMKQNDSTLRALDDTIRALSR